MYPERGLGLWLRTSQDIVFLVPRGSPSQQLASSSGCSLLAYLPCTTTANAVAAPSPRGAPSAASRGGSTFPPPGHQGPDGQGQLNALPACVAVYVALAIFLLEWSVLTHLVTRVGTPCAPSYSLVLRVSNAVATDLCFTSYPRGRHRPVLLLQCSRLLALARLTL